MKNEAAIKFILEAVENGVDLFSLRELYPTGEWKLYEKARQKCLDKKWIKVVKREIIDYKRDYNYILTHDGRVILGELRGSKQKKLFDIKEEV